MAQSVTLFLFAHQDDEFGVFYEIHRLVSRGAKVIVAVFNIRYFRWESVPN